MNVIIKQINSAGSGFVEFAVPMLLQASVLILILLLADLVLRKKVRAVFRYWIWMLVLLKLVLPVSLSSPLSLGYFFGDKLVHVDIPAPTAEALPAPLEPLPADLQNIIDVANINTDFHTPPVTDIPSLPVQIEPQVTTAPPTPVTPVTWQGVVFILWLAVVSAMGLLLLQRAMFVRGLVAQAKEANGPMKESLRFCRGRLGFKSDVELKISANTTSPAVCGLLRPVILMPQNLAPTLDPASLWAVLMHELAHIKRRDLWVNLAQTILQIVYFYNPLFWLANAIIRRVREQAVDEAVLVAMGEKARQYPQALVNVAKLAFKRPALGLRLIGVVESKGALTRRIKHILNRPLPKSARLGILGLIVVVIAGAVLLPMAKAKENQELLKGIDEKLKVTDKAGELIINSLYMPSPNGKRLVGTNKVTMYVDVTSNSEKDLYLGLEYYTDSGTIAKVFSPGATSLAQIKKVPANWQGKLEYPIYYNRFVKGGYVKITLAKCAGKQNMKEKKLAFLPPEVEIIYEKKHNIVPIDDVHFTFNKKDQEVFDFALEADNRDPELSKLTAKEIVKSFMAAALSSAENKVSQLVTSSMTAGKIKDFQNIKSVEDLKIDRVYYAGGKYALATTSTVKISWARKRILFFRLERRDAGWWIYDMAFNKLGQYDRQIEQFYTIYGDLPAENENPPSKLAFHVVPNIDSGRQPNLSRQQFEQYSRDLQSNGPAAGNKEYRWMPAKQELKGDLPLSTYQGRQYILLCSQSTYVMNPADGWALKKVYTALDNMNRPMVGISFDRNGGELFYKLTKENLQNSLAIVIDDQVNSAPKIQTPVRAAAIITGSFSESEAEKTAIALQQGMSPGKSHLWPGAEKAPQTQFSKTLPNGVTVELLCLYYGKNNGDMKFWRPDGSLISGPEAVPFRDRAILPGWTNPDFKFEYGAMIKFDPLDNLSTNLFVETGDRMSYSFPKTKGIAVALVASDRAVRKEGFPESGSIKVAAANGPWKIRKAGASVIRPMQLYLDDKTHIMFSPMRQEKDQLLVDITLNAYDVDVKCSYELKDGSIHGATGWSTIGHPNWIGPEQRTPLITEVYALSHPKDQILNYIVKHRRFEIVEFKNVSLKPNLKTDVQIELEKSTSEKSANIEKRYENVTFIKGMSIKEALRALGEMYKRNIIPSDKVDGQVPVSALYNVTFEEVLNAILGTHKYIIDGNFIRVYTEEEYKAIRPSEKTVVPVEAKKSKTADVPSPDKWIHKFPDGSQVKLVAVFRPKEKPLNYWDPDGRSVSVPLPEWKSRDVAERRLAVVLEHPQQFEGQNPASDGKFYSVYGWREVDFSKPLTAYYSQGYGDWKEFGGLHHGLEISHLGQSYTLAKVEDKTLGRNKQILVTMWYGVNPDIGIRLVAVDKKGKKYPMEAADIWIGGAPKGHRTMYFKFAGGLNEKELSHFILQKRPMDTARFSGFATEPKKTDVQVEKENVKAVIDDFWAGIDSGDFDKVRQASQIEPLVNQDMLQETLIHCNKERKGLLSRGIDTTNVYEVRIEENEAVAVAPANKDRFQWYYLQKNSTGWVIKSFDDALPSLSMEDIFFKCRSIPKLAVLGAALRLHAAEHNSQCPDTLKALEPYIPHGEIYQWLNDNIEYLGAGKKMQPGGFPDSIIAYTKTLLSKDENLSVLYNDASVSFELTKKFKQPKTDVQVEIESVGDSGLITQGKTDEVKYEGRTIDEWIAQWDSKLYDDTRAATQALIKIGRPAVPRMVEEVKKRTNHGWHAVGVLAKMGPAAEDALELLIATALDKDLRFGDSRQSPAAYRGTVLHSLSKMTWAKDRVTPVLQRIAQDGEEDPDVRASAIWALTNIPKEAMPILAKLTEAEDRRIRDSARSATAEVMDKEGRLTKSDYYTQLIEKDPFDPSVPGYLGSSKGIINLGHPHPLTQKIKKLYRQRLATEPDPELAWRLATIIQNGLRNTDLEWAAPAGGGRGRSPREDPAESYATLAEVLELGFRHAQPDSQLWRKFGIALAKLRLLQGDWDGMNAMLQKLGQEPIPKESRQWLHAPPVDWEEDTDSQWKIADESMRSGNCSLEFKIEKAGKGLKGVHVLVKRAPEPTNVVSTGIRTDTLFFEPYPMKGFGSFGYKSKDRPMTRYAVSDESGIVRFEKLPNIPIKIEVLVPTSNFPEAVSNWDLWMEVEPGKYKIAKKYGAGAINTQVPPAVAELKEGQTVHYPNLVVQPAFGMNTKDFQRVNKNDFVLNWQGLDAAKLAKNVHYELEMSLSAPGVSHYSVEHAPVIKSLKQITKENQWPVGAEGVGGLHLEPGNIYMFEVRAVDKAGTVIARWPRTRVWIPWGYRQSKPPFAPFPRADPYNSPPIYEGAWWKGEFGYHDKPDETLRQKAARYLRDYPDAFEYEYVRLGKAWLDWHDGDNEGAREELEELANRLPKGSVVRGTAVWLLQQMDEGKLPLKRLNFMPDRETSRPKAIPLPDTAGDSTDQVLNAAKPDV